MEQIIANLLVADNAVIQKVRFILSEYKKKHASFHIDDIHSADKNFCCPIENKNDTQNTRIPVTFEKKKSIRSFFPCDYVDF